MQKGKPNGTGRKPNAESRKREAAGGTYAEKRLPELERQRRARIKRLQELERQQIDLHNRRIENAFLGKRNNSKAYDKPTIVMVFLTVVLLLWSAVNYVEKNSNLHQSNTELASLKKEYEQLQVDNDNREALLNASVDAQQIYWTATQQLGMNYPEKHQVIIYHKTESGYVAQYEDIPQ